MKKRLWTAISLLLLPLLLLSGCWQEELPDEEEETLLQPEELAQADGSRFILPERFSLPYAPDLTLDPVSCADGMQQLITSLMCEGLFRLGPDFEPQPWLCQTYAYDATAFTYVFTLRAGVVFSDGSPLTSADVKAALERARASERYGARLSGITGISAGDGSVTVTLSSPNTALPSVLDIPICKAGTETMPIGTGPYLFSMEQSGAWLVTNQSWWRGDGQPVDRIALVEASDQDTMLYRFASHDVQLVAADLTGTTPASVTGNVLYHNADTTILQYIGCNVLRPPLDNAALRRCLGLGIDRTYLVSAFLSGHGTASQFPVSPASPLYPTGLEEPYSHSAFAADLTQSGYLPERPLILLINQENSFKVSIAQQIAQSLTAGGVPVEVRVLPWAEYTAALAAGQFDLYYGEIKLTADWNLSPLLATGGALNFGGWADVRTDQLLTGLTVASDRAAAMERLCAYLQTQAPILPVCFKSTSVLIQSGTLEGLEPTMAEPLYNLTDCTIHLQDNP